MNFLNVTDDVLKKYRNTVKGNLCCTKEECQRKLTRDFLVGSIFEKSDGTLVSNYGNLLITVKDKTVIDVLNMFDKKTFFSKNKKNLIEWLMDLKDKNIFQKVLDKITRI